MLDLLDGEFEINGGPQTVCGWSAVLPRTPSVISSLELLGLARKQIIGDHIDGPLLNSLEPAKIHQR